MKKRIVITVGSLIVLVMAVYAGLALTKPPALNDGGKINVKVDRSQVKVDIAAAKASRDKGLGGRPTLPADQGMLFVFTEPAIVPFWMKGVTFPIDIIWINNQTVTDITANVPPAGADTPDDKLPQYASGGPIDRVLEVPAGWASQHSIQPGDPVRFTRR